MGSGFFNVGVSGLNAAQAGMLTSGHNISNASTPGFNRQQVVQTTNTPLFTGSGFMGQGTSIETVRRVYSDFLTKQVLSAETSVAELDTHAAQVDQLSNMLADASAGLAPSLQAFFDATSDVASNPGSMPARQALLSASQGVVARFHSLDSQLSAIRTGVNSQINSEIGTINSLVTQIGDINQRITVAQAGGPGQPANDLYDQRDQLIADLNKEVRVSVQVESDGSYSLFFGTGQPLVVGPQVYQLQAVPAPEDMAQTVVALKAPSGQVQQLQESLIGGGNLGGLLEFRRGSLDQVQNNLGRIALAVASNVNEQHRLGVDLSGDAGGDFFTPVGLDVLAGSANRGSAALSADLVVSDYRVAYDGTSFTVTRLADNTQTSYGELPLNVDGVEISIASGALAGSAANPDVFIVKPGELPGRRVTALAGNAGSAKLDASGSNLQVLSGSDFRLTLSAPNTFTLTRLSDDQTWRASGSTQQDALANLMVAAGPQGFNLSLSANTANVGDSYLIRPTRNAARDINLAITDGRDIAAAAPIRTGAGLANAGTASITPGVVSDTAVPLGASFDIRYEASSASFVGFPVGATVMVDDTRYTVSSPTTRIPYRDGANISVSGVGVRISGTPADGDVFTINPPGTAPTIPTNTGLADMFGTPAAGTRGAAAGTLAGAIPLSFFAGVDDEFAVSIDGAAPPTTVTLTGPYASNAALASDIQTQIGAGAAVSIVNGQLMISSASSGAGSSVTLSATNGGLATLFNVPNAGDRVEAMASTALADPVTIVQASNDRFSISVDGTTKTLAIPAGSYTPAALAAQMQTSINAALTPASVTVGLSANRLVVTSNQVGGTSAVTLAAGTNTGTGVPATGTVTSTASLPAANIALTYRQADGARALPDRLTGLPVGSVVTVTPPGGGAPTEYAISTTDDYVPFTSGATLAFNGMSFAINGTPAAGDVFNIEANRSGSGDARNILAIQSLQTVNTLSDGGATYQTSYAQMVSQVGNKSREIEVTLKAQENLATRNRDAVQSMSGVNLDEEAANLMRYQQAYQASAKMLEMASKLFDTLLGIAAR